jgi:hypothetical protein
MVIIGCATAHNAKEPLINLFLRVRITTSTRETDGIAQSHGSILNFWLRVAR